MPNNLLAGPWTTWRPGQAEALIECMDWLSGTQKFLAISMGTGGGKSLIPMLMSKMTPLTMSILTATRALQDQYSAQFKGHMEDIRGMNNYVCRIDPPVRTSEGTCLEDIPCILYENGCYYYDQVRKAKAQQVVISNYAYYMSSMWMHQRALLICDEAHHIESAIEAHLTAWCPYYETDLYKLKELIAEWVDNLKEAAKTRASKKPELRIAREALQAVGLAISAPDDWVVQQDYRRGGCVIAPIHAGKHLAKFPGRIILMSATLTKHHLKRLGLNSNDQNSLRFVEYGSAFKAEHTPIRHVWTSTINHRSTSEDMSLLAAGLDRVINKYPGKRGLVFTASYRRGNWLMSNSKWADTRLIGHTAGNVREKVEEWRTSKDGVLLSPTVTDGWDLPEADFIVVCKVPYPDTTGTLSIAKKKHDPQWPAFTAMQTMVQQCGRGTRSDSDRCDVWVLDDSWSWFWQKYSHFAPGWFAQRVKGNVKQV